jgi:hypothetical protein
MIEAIVHYIRTQGYTVSVRQHCIYLSVIAGTRLYEYRWAIVPSELNSIPLPFWLGSADWHIQQLQEAIEQEAEHV